MAQLSDAELDRILEASGALHPAQRAAFEAAVIAEWQRLPPATRGPGTLHQIIATAQRSFVALAVGPSPGNLSRYGKAALRAKGK